MLCPADFSRLKFFVEENTGITIPESNYQQVQHYLSGRIGDYTPSIDTYLKKIPGDQSEYGRLMEAVTINETYFFREEKHFIYLRDSLLPLLREKQREISIWSSSCSSGEEALSLYALAIETIKEPERIRIFASDINNKMLDRFRQGVYRPSSFREDGACLVPLIKSIAEELLDRCWKIAPLHLGRINIFNSNLFLPQAEHLPKMDIIFLRNTLIYMNFENKRKIIDNVVNRLKTGGVLFLAAAELPLISHPSLTIEDSGDIYFFRKKNPQSLSREVLSGRISQAANRKTKPGPARVKPVYKTLPRPKTAENEAQAENEICNIISMKLNNRIYNPGSLRKELAADFIIRILDSANEEEPGIEKKLLAALSENPAAEMVPGLFSYLLAGIHYGKGQRAEAEKLYRKALENNRNLWPARFFLIKVLSPDHPELKNQLICLKKEIEKYICSHRWDYQFLLEGFNARYFLMICEKMYAETKRRNSKDGN